MKSAENFESYEMNWKNFLSNLDRGWNKLEKLLARCNSVKKSDIDKVIQHRNTDSLLQYLKQARNANEHTIEQIVDKSPAATRITGGPGGGIIYRGSVSGGKESHSLVYDNLEIEFIPESLCVIKVTNRGKTYPPPQGHLNKPIKTKIPHEIAQIGLDFYLNFLAVLNTVRN
tara:strand:+ start:722 stop:1237 length:516 start_codon:yes stop_codon:yes gene_type:complete